MSDEYHTMDELYEYRMLYNGHSARGWRAAGIPVVKSWRHSDGEPCFGQDRVDQLKWRMEQKGLSLR